MRRYRSLAGPPRARPCSRSRARWSPAPRTCGRARAPSSCPAGCRCRAGRRRRSGTRRSCRRHPLLPDARPVAVSEAGDRAVVVDHVEQVVHDHGRGRLGHEGFPTSTPRACRSRRPGRRRRPRVPSAEAGDEQRQPLADTGRGAADQAGRPTSTVRGRARIVGVGRLGARLYICGWPPTFTISGVLNALRRSPSLGEAFLEASWSSRTSPTGRSSRPSCRSACPAPTRYCTSTPSRSGSARSSNRMTDDAGPRSGGRGGRPLPQHLAGARVEARGAVAAEVTYTRPGSMAGDGEA